MNVGNGELDNLPARYRQGSLFELAAKCRPANLSDSDRHHLKRFRIRPECQIDGIANLQAPNLFAKLHIINAFATAQLLDILDLDGSCHGKSDRQLAD
jgi:hypothetical protein